MSLDNETVDTIKPDAGISVPGEAEPAPERSEAGGSDDIEARARAMGWVAQEEFRGPADKWRPADEFVKKGEEDLPVLRERLRSTTGKLTDLERKLQQRDEEVRRIERMSSLALERQREQIDAQYQAAMRAAVEAADITRYDQLRHDRGQALNSFDRNAYEVVQQPQQQQQPPQQQRARPLTPDEMATRDKWLKSNPWFMFDGEMAAVANARHEHLVKERPDLSFEQNLNEVTNYVRSRYQDKFGAAGSSRSVEGGSRVPSSLGPRKRGASDLPADARTAGERYIKQGLFKDMNEYAAEYWSQE